MNTAEPLTPEPSPFEVNVAIEKLKRYIVKFIDQFTAELIQAGDKILRSENHKFTNSAWNKKEFPHQWKKSIIIPTYEKCDETDNSRCRETLLLPTVYKILSSHHSSDTEKKWVYNGRVHKSFIDFEKAYVSVIEFGIPMKEVRLIKMCLNEPVLKFTQIKICQMHFLFRIV
jgi:hypothetical protein